MGGPRWVGHNPILKEALGGVTDWLWLATNTTTSCVLARRCPLSRVTLHQLSKCDSQFLWCKVSDFEVLPVSI